MGGSLDDTLGGCREVAEYDQRIVQRCAGQRRPEFGRVWMTTVDPRRDECHHQKKDSQQSNRHLAAP